MENGQKKGNTKNEKETKMRNKQIITKKKKKAQIGPEGKGRETHEERPKQI